MENVAEVDPKKSVIFLYQTFIEDLRKIYLGRNRGTPPFIDMRLRCEGNGYAK